MAFRPPVIGHVLHRLYLAGAEVLAADLARRLGGDAHGGGEQPYRFVFLCLDQIGPLGEQLAGEGFTVIDLQRRPGVDWSVAKQLHRAVREHHIDLLHAHQYTPFFYAAASRGLGRRPPILFTEHGRHYPDYRSPKRVFANRFLFGRGDHATAVGRFVKQALVDHEGLNPDRIEVIYNGVDPDRFGADSGHRRAVRADLGLNEDRPVLMQVARFHPVKDHATAIRAFSHASQRVPGAVFLLVGDGDLRAQNEALADELGLEGRVRFLGVRDDVARLMPAADVFVLSSLSEGISVTLLEAMATGLSIVATDVGGNGEVVEDGVTGLLSPRRDADGLGRNMATLLGDPDLRRTMGAAGHQRLLLQFSQQQMHEAYARCYERMLKPGRPG